MESNKRAILYLRLSKEDLDKIEDGDDSASIQNQQLLLTDFAIKEGFQIVGIYKDDNRSGLFDDRPGFEQLINGARQGTFDIVVAKSQSRFTRNMEHLEKYIHHEFLEWGIRFIGVLDNVDTAVKGNKKTRQIHGLINEWYSEDLSENIRATFKVKMQQGQFLGSSTPYGYIKDPADHHHLVIDEYAAGIVKRIYDMYLSGIGKGKIGAILSSEGILIPTIYKKTILKQNYHNANAMKTTHLWSYQTIHQILKNEVYIGNMVQNKCSSPSYKIRQKKGIHPDEWIRVGNTHEEIIDKETFASVQKLMQRKTRQVKNMERVGIFSGFLFCYDCKHTMLRSYNKKKEFDGFVCKIYKQHGNKFCTSHKISENELIEAVLKSLKVQAKMILQPEDIESLRNIETSSLHKINEQKLLIEKLSNQKEELKDIKVQAYLDYVSKILNLEEYAACKEKLDRQGNDIELHLKQIEESADTEDRISQEYDEWILKFRNYIDVDTLTREMLVEMVDKIYIHQNNQIDIHFNFKNPYNI